MSDQTELEKCCQMVIAAGLATGHADTVTELVAEVLGQVAELRRRANCPYSHLTGQECGYCGWRGKSGAGPMEDVPVEARLTVEEARELVHLVWYEEQRTGEVLPRSLIDARAKLVAAIQKRALKVSGND